MSKEIDYKDFYQETKNFWKTKYWNISIEEPVFKLCFDKVINLYNKSYYKKKDFDIFIRYFEDEVDNYLELLFYHNFNSLYEDKKYPEVFKAICMGKIVQYEQSHGVWVDYITRPYSIKSYSINEELAWRVKEEVSA